MSLYLMRVGFGIGNTLKCSTLPSCFLCWLIDVLSTCSGDAALERTGIAGLAESVVVWKMETQRLFLMEHGIMNGVDDGIILPASRS